VNVIFWVTGAPNSGKSTFSDMLAHSIIEELGIEPIRLDGDSLRVVLGESDIHDETNREKLAHTYLQIAKYLALQRKVVIVSTVAPFASIYKNFEDSRVRIIPILLIVDEETANLRNHRRLNSDRWQVIDAHLKSLVTDSKYLVENNSMEISKAKISLFVKLLKGIIQDGKNFDFLYNRELLFQISSSAEAKRDYWNLTYESQSYFSEPSSFAKSVSKKFDGKSRLKLFDIGCGDGRDALFFSHQFETFGFDNSETAISICEERANQSGLNAKFINLKSMEGLSNHIRELQPDIIYLRFVLHALNELEEIEFFSALRHCKQGAQLFIETRTILDEKINKGLRLSANEGYDGHYRRFTKPEVLKSKLHELGFKLESFLESKGLSRLRDDDPSLLRVIAVKS
jgi:2-polyprenyl-3-methyl-5-hydroxy-6-metoxy-1,4-benzoquinol methylase